MKFNAETYNEIYHPAPEAANVAAHIVKANKPQEPQEPQEPPEPQEPQELQEPQEPQEPQESQEPQEPEPTTGGDESGGNSESTTE